MRSLTWEQVEARRLAASRLDERAPHAELLDVVRAVCGVHAQLATGAELALSARVEGVTGEIVRELLWEARALVKAGTVRGTLHLHPARELGLWKSLQATQERWREPSWLGWQRLGLAEAEDLRERVLDVLADGEPRTRQEIGAAVGGPLGEHIGSDSWGQYLAPAGGLLCHGPPRGRAVTFVRCDRWIEGWRPEPPDDALRAACRRYLETYGPARREELEHWLAMRVPDEALAGLEEVDVEGRRALVAPDSAFAASAPSGVRLLWHYDVYVVGCHPRERLIPSHRESIFHRGAGPRPALLVDGRVAGTWSRMRRGRRMEIRVAPFTRLPARRRAELADDAQRVAATYGAEAVLHVE